MPDIQVSGIADMLVATLENLGRMKYTDVISEYQNTVVLRRLVKKHKMNFSGGDRCQWNLITDHNDSARGVGLYYQAQVNPTNVLTTGSVDWKHSTFNWAVERREIAMNAGSANKILDIVKTRRIAALASNVLYFEQQAWSTPDSSDDVNFLPIPYWIVKSSVATTTNDGFNGSLPTGFTDVAGINPNAVGITPKWNNYTDIYTDISNDDLINKLERAADYTNFMPLVEEIPTYNVGNDYMYCTTRNVRYGLKEILKNQNESLGFDLDPVNNKLMFRRTPFIWVKQLDNDTTGPIYGINWGVFGFQGLSGEWMRETVFDKHPNQPTTAATHVDSTCNTKCYDRRRNFVLATGTGMPA